MKVVVDSLEGEYAVLLFGDQEVKVDFPVVLLPEGAQEGCWLKVTMEIDYEGTKGQKNKISDLLNKLRNKNEGP